MSCTVCRKHWKIFFFLSEKADGSEYYPRISGTQPKRWTLNVEREEGGVGIASFTAAQELSFATVSIHVVKVASCDKKNHQSKRHRGAVVLIGTSFTCSKRCNQESRSLLRLWVSPSRYRRNDWQHEKTASSPVARIDCKNVSSVWIDRTNGATDVDYAQALSVFIEK